MWNGARKVDANQAEIIAALLNAGCSVFLLSAVGGGMGDLLVGRKGVNYILEVKSLRLNKRAPARRGKLTAVQVKFVGAWLGQYNIVATIEEAFKVVGLKVVAPS